MYHQYICVWKPTIIQCDAFRSKQFEIGHFSLAYNQLMIQFIVYWGLFSILTPRMSIVLVIVYVIYAVPKIKEGFRSINPTDFKPFRGFYFDCVGSAFSDKISTFTRPRRSRQLLRRGIFKFYFTASHYIFRFDCLNV